MRTKINMKFWVGIIISLLLMGLLFRKIDFNSLITALRTVDYRYIALAIVFTFLGYFLRAVRWRFLLSNGKSVPLASLYSATVIGYMANNLLPARLGEFVRAYTLARRENLEGPSVFATLVVDRLCDGFTVLLLLVFTLFTLKFPVGMEDAARALRAGGIVMFAGYTTVVLFLWFLKMQTERTLDFVRWVLSPLPARLAGRFIPLLSSFINGIRLPASVRDVSALAVTSAVVWFFCLVPVDMTLRSFHIYLPYTASLFILILLVFAVMVPSSPGFIGTFHFACYKGLSVFGVPDATSVSVALVMHATSFFPVIAAGLYYLWKNKMSLNDLQRVD